MALTACVDHGRTVNSGAGYAKVAGVYLHRTVCAQHHGMEVSDIPPGIFVRHACDNPRCINPEHLLFGTPQDNTNDMLERERMARGSARPNSVLTEVDVRFIRRMYKPRSQTFGTRALARLLGVSQWTISHAIRGLTWSHVDG